MAAILLDVEPDQLDAVHFERLVGDGGNALDRGDARAARDLLSEALDLWRGPALGDLAYEQFAQPEIARLDELRFAALDARIEADLALGRHTDLIPELETLVRGAPGARAPPRASDPSLYRSGRQADALAAYQGARRALAEELGLEPSKELQALEHAILTQDPAIDAPSRRPRRVDAARGRRSGALVAVGGALLLLAVLAAIAATSGDEPGPKRATAQLAGGDRSRLPTA